MQVVLPEATAAARLTFDGLRIQNDDEYFAFCVANPDLHIERTAKGEVVIMAPVGSESAYRSSEVVGELRSWAKRDKRGKAFDSSGEFILPTGAALCPDASWVSNARLATLTKAELKKFPRLSPEFVIEVMSPSDRLKAAKLKMTEWIAGGVDLGWLIDGDRETVYVYRNGQKEPEKFQGISKLAGEGPVAGFELDLAEIWEGL